MEAKELRIGNYVSKNNKTYIVSNGGDINESKILEPILLTHEWLLEFGFVQDYQIEKGFIAGYAIDKSKGEFAILQVLGGFYLAYDDGTKLCPFPAEPFKYINQLQNLFSILTEEELTIIPIIKEDIR